MQYQDAESILNRHIFEGDKVTLLKNIANNPERYVGLFRPTKPKAKILQNLLQSHEIRFGDALEELIHEMLEGTGFSMLPNTITDAQGSRLLIDQYFTIGSTTYFVEQKVRDDHDSTKKRGQINNFEAKLEILKQIHPTDLVGIMYFIDPDLTKNKNFYLQEIERLKEFYQVDLYLFYGHELFDHLQHPELWRQLLQWLAQWKTNLPDLPEMNFDLNPEESCQQLLALNIRYWRRLFQNDPIWEEGIMRVLFQDGTTLRLIMESFTRKPEIPFPKLTNELKRKMDIYYS